MEMTARIPSQEMSPEVPGESLGANPAAAVVDLVTARIDAFPAARLRQIQLSSRGYTSRLRELDSVAIQQMRDNAVYGF